MTSEEIRVWSDKFLSGEPMSSSRDPVVQMLGGMFFILSELTAQVAEKWERSVRRERAATVRAALRAEKKL
jgi:hypothetical protein